MRVLVLLLVAALLGCGSNSGSSSNQAIPQVAGLVRVIPPSGNQTSQTTQVGPLTIAKISGDNAVASVATPTTLVVEVRDGNGDAVVGAYVTFTAKDPAKPLTGLGSVVTDSTAQAWVTAGPYFAGPQEVEVHASTAFLSAAPVTFSLTGQ